jgi:glucan-binding YG repeat protein
MRKQTKLAVGISAAALLAVGASMTSFAARGWVAEGDQWYYYDNNGDYVTDKWKTYNGNYFYLGDDGYMLTNELVEDGDNYYYVDANGAMVKNCWVAVPAEDDEEQDVDYRWYYFGSNGKAFKNNDKKSINGKKYGFDDQGKMLFGFVDSSRTILNNETDPVLSCTRYYGSNDDGAMHTGWLRYEDALEDDDYDDEYYWFWFDSKGVKKQDGTKKINGKTYAFNEDGAMKKEWYDATISGQATTGYYSDSMDDGSLQKSTWIWTDNDKRSHDGGDDNHWWHTDKHGFLHNDCTKKINGKWYAFDGMGEMRWGLVWLSTTSVKNGNSNSVVAAKDPADVSSADIYNETYGSNLFFFSADEEKDGSMKTGSSVKIELFDDDFTFGFDKNTGLAYEGVHSNKLYDHGILQKADDDKYKKFTVDGKDYLVNTSGTRIKAGATRTYKDDNDEYWGVKSGTDATGYDVYGPYDTAEACRNAMK